MEGCIGVFHVAHLVDFENKETEEMITNKSVEATLGILKACLNSKTVKRVVYTSSSTTIILNEKGPDVLDEEWWSDVDYNRKNLNSVGASYAVSKTVTERAALEFAESNSLDVVCDSGMDKWSLCVSWLARISEVVAGYDYGYKYGLDKMYDEAIECRKKKGIL